MMRVKLDCVQKYRKAFISLDNLDREILDNPRRIEIYILALQRRCCDHNIRNAYRIFGGIKICKMSAVGKMDRQGHILRRLREHEIHPDVFNFAVQIVELK